MKTLKYIALFLGFSVFSFSAVLSQSKATIENVDFFQDGDNIIIKYDILKAKKDESFMIWVEVISLESGRISPKSLIGDVGNYVTGGKGKEIVWNVKGDNIDLDEEISIEVMGKPNVQAAEYIQDPVKVRTERKVSVPTAMGLSLILPGLGNTYAKKGGAYWLLGVAGYGMIAGSVIMNNSAYNTYQDYKDEKDASDRKDLYDKADQKDKISKYLIYGAAGIWALDLLWTGLQAGSVNRKYRASKVMIYPVYDPLHQSTGVNLTIRFN